jgi:sterol desaturase/sphingolipid hydroxylase (fatty acid hydroxylase superfamily)
MDIDQTWLLHWGYLVLVLILVGIDFLMIAVEKVKPNIVWPETPKWTFRAWLSKGWLYLLVITFGFWGANWMVAYRPWHLDSLGVFWGGLFGYFVYTFIFYWWHALRHKPWYWRWLHQIHHSPQRIETITTFYKNPVEQVIDFVFASAVLYLLCGLNVAQVLWATFLVGWVETFYHWNIKTPYWLGWFVQRPEMHFIHHQTDVQSFNFSDISIWDMLFGTYRNPRYWHGKCGFSTKEEMELGKMMAGVDVSTPPNPKNIDRLIAEASTPPADNK